MDAARQGLAIRRAYAQPATVTRMHNSMMGIELVSVPADWAL